MRGAKDPGERILRHTLTVIAFLTAEGILAGILPGLPVRVSILLLAPPLKLPHYA